MKKNAHIIFVYFVEKWLNDFSVPDFKFSFYT